MPMHPRPIAETKSPLFPSCRVFIFLLCVTRSFEYSESLTQKTQFQVDGAGEQLNQHYRNPISRELGVAQRTSFARANSRRDDVRRCAEHGPVASQRCSEHHRVEH